MVPTDGWRSTPACFLGYKRSTQTPNGPDDWFEISGHARPGDSGGGVFNQRGRLVGVLWGTNGEVVVGVQAGRLHLLLDSALPERIEQKVLRPDAVYRSAIRRRRSRHNDRELAAGVRRQRRLLPAARARSSTSRPLKTAAKQARRRGLAVAWQGASSATRNWTPAPATCSKRSRRNAGPDWRPSDRSRRRRRSRNPSSPRMRTTRRRRLSRRW